MYTLDMLFLGQECSVTDLVLDWPFTLISLVEFAGRRDSIDLKEEGEQLDSVAKAWLEPLLGLKHLRRLTISHGQGIRYLPRYTLRITSTAVPACSESQPEETLKSFSRFLELPRKVREPVYLLTMLPSDNTIYPYLRSWYDSETRKIIPLFLTCRQIYKEAQETFYTSASFASSIERYNTRFLKFLEDRRPAIRAQIRHIRILAHANLSFDLMFYLAPEMSHVRLTYVIPEYRVKVFVREW